MQSVRKRYSALAFVALAMSVMGCCPLVSAIGSTLGIVALRRITQSNGALRGRRVANAAVLTGLCVTIAGALAWSRLVNSVREWTNDLAVTAVEQFVRAAETNDSAAARQFWSTSSARFLGDDDITGFGERIAQRYGSLRGFRIISVVPGPTTIPATLEYAGTFVFDRAELTGSVELELEPNQSFNPPFHVRLMAITIEDRPQGDIVLSPGKSPAKMNPASSMP